MYLGVVIIIAVYNNATDSFEFKEKIIDKTGKDGSKNVEIMVPLKHLTKFWRSSEIRSLKCLRIELHHAMLQIKEKCLQ